MKTNVKKALPWIQPICWAIVVIQGLYIIQTRTPETLRTIGIEKFTYQFFTTIGLLDSDREWELSRDEDRTQLKQSLKRIDPYSSYLSEDQFESFSMDTKQEYEGIGVTLLARSEGVEIRDVFEHSPAEYSGLQVGDIITHLNDYSIRGWQFKEVIDHIRGHAGTSLQMKIIRDNQVLPIHLRRSSIDLPSIRNIHLTDEGIIYMKIDQFGEKTSKEFLTTLRGFTNQAIKGLVIDLRENTGGVLKSSIDMLDAFYPKGEMILQTKDTQNNRVRTFRARHPNLLGNGNIPTLIFVNRNSASASEILAGSLQVTGKALIIGETTHGKGSIQSVYQLNKGDAFKKTTSYYYFPDGSSIHEVGIKPDITVEISRSDYYEYLLRDRQGIVPYNDPKDPYWAQAMRYLNNR